MVILLEPGATPTASLGVRRRKMEKDSTRRAIPRYAAFRRLHGSWNLFPKGVHVQT
ncbi:hypothetical protein WAI453_010610 [Rhynchosporium graminicola]